MQSSAGTKVAGEWEGKVGTPVVLCDWHCRCQHSRHSRWEVAAVSVSRQLAGPQSPRTVHIAGVTHREVALSIDMYAHATAVTSLLMSLDLRRPIGDTLT